MRFPVGSRVGHEHAGGGSSPGGARESSRLGMTVVELVIALGVLALFTAIAIPLYVNYVERAEIKTAVADIRMLETAIERDRIEFGRLPNDIGRLAGSLTDPWGTPYEYLHLGSGEPGVSGERRRDRNMNPINSDYDLYSMGKDGQTKPQLNSELGRDDVVRANDGAFVGLASDY